MAVRRAAVYAPIGKEDPPTRKDDVRCDSPEQLAAEEELARLRRGLGRSRPDPGRKSSAAGFSGNRPAYNSWKGHGGLDVVFELSNMRVDRNLN